MDDGVAGPDLAPLVDRLHEVYDLVHRISDDVGPGTVRGVEAIIERRRAEVNAAMEALGLAMHEFVQAGPTPDRLAAAQHLVMGRLREISLTSPVVLYGTPGKRARMSYFEIVQHVQAGRLAGADVAARVLDDYYVHTRIGQAFVNRLVLLRQRLAEAVSRRQSAGSPPTRLISLQYVGGEELLQLARDANALAGIQVACVDSDSAAVRHAELTLRPTFGTRIQITMADPVRWAQGPAYPPESANVVYAVALLEELVPKRVTRILEGVHRLLRPGGILLLGCTPGHVPVAEGMIRDWLMGWHWQYRSESEWRELFAQSPFGADRLTFEYEPLGISALVRAEKTN